MYLPGAEHGAVPAPALREASERGRELHAAQRETRAGEGGIRHQAEAEGGGDGGGQAGARVAEEAGRGGGGQPDEETGRAQGPTN